MLSVMPVERFYSNSDLLQGSSLSLEGTEFHHLVHVIRMQEGETVELVNGRGFLASAQISQITKKYALLTITNVFFEPAPSYEVILAQAIPRMNRLDFILEKGTELGMTQLWLFPGMKGERRQLTDAQIERMHAVMIAAMKQSGRLYCPQILLKSPLNQWPQPEYKGFFGDVDRSAPIFEHVFKKQKPSVGVVLYIGPESGFSVEEVTKLKEWNTAGVKLHQNILRTDTAALASLALVNHWILPQGT